MRRTILAVVITIAGLLAPLGVVSPASAVNCTSPRYVTSHPDGMWSNWGYWVHNNMWNASGYQVSQTLRACNFRNWYVRARANNNSGDCAVKTYPTVHKDFHNWNTGAEPRVSSFKSIVSRFASRTPGVGIYNAAYDIWLNGVPGNREVMIWTDNLRQHPGGRVVARRVALSGRYWNVWATSDGRAITFTPMYRLTYGSVNIKQMLHWLMVTGRVQRTATLGQIGFGFEIVSTSNYLANFEVTNFSVATARW